MKTKSTLLKLLFFISFLINSVEKIFSQDYLEKTYYSDSEVNGLKIIPSEDNGYYILYTSQIYSRPSVQHKIILKVDSAGTFLWSNDFDYQEYAVTWMPCDMVLSADTFVYTIGHTIGCFDNATIYKFDRSGNILFNRDTLGFIYQYSKLNKLCSMPGNDVLAGGYISNNSTCNVVAPYLLRMNPNGSPVWQMRWDTLYPGLQIQGITAYTDSTFIINLSDSSNILVNDSGQIIPSNFPNGRFKCLSNGDYITYSQHQLSRITNALTPVWQSPVFSDITINDLAMNDSAELFLTGRKDSCNGEMIIQKYDTAGNLIFTRFYGGDLNDNGSNLIAPDVSHIAAIGNHFHHHWLINDATTSGCRIAVTHSASLKLIVMPDDVLSSDQISSSTGGYNLCANDTITLTAPAGFTYSWNTGSTDQQITINTSGSYEVTITDAFGNSEVLPIFNSYEYEAPVTPHFADVNYTMCTGNFEEICFAVEHSDSIYDRNFNWNIIDFQSTFPIIQAPFGGFPAGTYFCVVSNMCGSDTSGYFVLENIPPNVSLGNDTVLCGTDSLLLVPEHSNSIYNIFLWQDGSQQSSLWAMDTTGYDTLIYSVTYSDAAGCSVTDSILVVFDDCTGISNVDLNSGMNVFPNPVSNILNIKLPQITSNEELIIRLMSIDGKIILQRLLHGNEILLDLSDVECGIYLLDVIAGNEKICRSRIVKGN